jgi:hypothetical protein
VALVVEVKISLEKNENSRRQLDVQMLTANKTNKVVKYGKDVDADAEALKLK